jgi:hypothetical protein
VKKSSRPFGTAGEGERIPQIARRRRSCKSFHLLAQVEQRRMVERLGRLVVAGPVV